METLKDDILINPTTADIIGQLNEKRALPMGVQDFHEWSDRLIQGAMVGASVASQKFALANMVLHLGPTECFKEDGYFINCLRKYACNEISHAMVVQLKEQAIAEESARLEASKSPEQRAAEAAVAETEKRAGLKVAPEA